jgi:GDP-mannose transporter
MQPNKLINSPFLSIAAYCFASIAMTVLNKAVLSSYNFNANFLLLAIQSAVCLVIIKILSAKSYISHRPFNLEDGKRWLVVAVSLVGMIYTGSKVRVN